MRKLGLGSICLLAMLSANANADNYWSIQYDAVTFGDDSDTSLEFGVIDFAYTRTFAKYFFVKGNSMWSQLNASKLAHDSVGTGPDTRIDSAQGLSLGAHKKFFGKLDIYSMVSYNIIHMDRVGSNNLGDNGLGYGAGLSYDVPFGALFFEYRTLLDNENDGTDPEDESMEALTSMGIGYKMEMDFK